MTLQQFLAMIIRHSQAFKDEWLEGRYDLSEKKGMESALESYPDTMPEEEWWQYFEEFRGGRR